MQGQMLYQVRSAGHPHGSTGGRLTSRLSYSYHLNHRKCPKGSVHCMVVVIACSSVQCSKTSQLSAHGISALSMHFVNLLNDFSVNYDANICIEKYCIVALYYRPVCIATSQYKLSRHAKRTPYFPQLSASIQNISSDTFYDPDGTQPTGYVGQVSLNSIQQNRRSCLGLSNLARSHIHHLHIIMHDTSQPHSFSALSTIFFRILPASCIAGPLQWLTEGSKQIFFSYFQHKFFKLFN